jgi:hypothetical protein
MVRSQLDGPLADVGEAMSALEKIAAWSEPADNARIIA